jgi:hypothetical protein
MQGLYRASILASPVAVVPSYARTETPWRRFNGPLVMPKMVVA